MKIIGLIIGLLSISFTAFANDSLFNGSYTLVKDDFKQGNTTRAASCKPEISIGNDGCIKIYLLEGGKVYKNYGPELEACNINLGNKLVEDADLGDGSHIVMNREAILVNNQLTVKNESKFYNKSGNLFDTQIETIVIKKSESNLTIDSRSTAHNSTEICTYQVQ